MPGPEGTPPRSTDKRPSSGKACARLSSKSPRRRPLPSSPHSLDSYQGPAPMTQPGARQSRHPHTSQTPGWRGILSK